MNKATQQFNHFAKMATADPLYEQVKEYAVNDFFMSQPEQTKEEIARAYARIETNRASATDMQLIMMYYSMAKASYKEREK